MDTTGNCPSAVGDMGIPPVNLTFVDQGCNRQVLFCCSYQQSNVQNKKIDNDLSKSFLMLH